MLRILSAAIRGVSRAAANAPVRSAVRTNLSILKNPDVPVIRFGAELRCFSLLSKGTSNTFNDYEKLFSCSTLLRNTGASVPATKVPARTFIKFTQKKGKRVTVRDVPKRFFRLNWGMWIRTKVGRNKKIWKKTLKRRQRIKRHVFTTPKQSWLLDTMVSRYWRRPKYWVDDPYNPYHLREEFWITRRKPQIVE